MSDGSNFTANIAYDDLREWLSYAERLGEVRSVRGASWQEDIGLAAEAVLRAENGPCVVFDDIPGCAKGFRLLLNVFAGRRRNMTLGFPDHLTKWELSDSYRKAYLENPRIIPHEIVSDGAIFENDGVYSAVAAIDLLDWGVGADFRTECSGRCRHGVGDGAHAAHDVSVEALQFVLAAAEQMEEQAERGAGLVRSSVLAVDVVGEEKRLHLFGFVIAIEEVTKASRQKRDELRDFRGRDAAESFGSTKEI